MEGIVHRTVEINGIAVHVAEKGGDDAAAAVLLLHGFPELWYSWRHQIVGLAARGYRAIAPDLRGYGDTSAPPSVNSYTLFHLVGDVVALLDALELPQVFVVGHDWGAAIAWTLCMIRPDRVKALVNTSVAHMPRNPSVSPVHQIKHLYGDNIYVCRFQEPGVAEAEFAEVGTKNVLRKILTMRDPRPSSLTHKDWGSTGEEIALPSWLSEEDLDYYASKFEKTGFTGGMNYYRCMNLNWELTAPWAGAKIQVPTKFIVGDLDLTYHYPNIQDYIHKGGFKNEVPLLEEVVVLEGVGHFIQQERAEEVTDHIYNFIKKF
uniref:soluble epoxide hydrolase n=1 Tax=Ananas comosus TaxID=4615 RepID=Q8H289_ANACO|nr:epoxide hydrolase [Ananas comosus]